MKNKIITYAACLLGMFSSQAQAGWSTPPGFHSLPRVNFENEPGDDTPRFVRQIRSFGPTGGIIRIKRSSREYHLGRIHVTDNIHIQIERGVRIRQSAQGNVFVMLGDNVSVTGATSGTGSKAVFLAMHRREGVSLRFRAIIAQNGGSNFLMQNFDIIENGSTFAPIEVRDYSNGTVRGIDMAGQGQNGSWGTMQLQGGANVDYFNIDGLGGQTARFEQNFAESFFDDINLRNIRVRYGTTALGISPHNTRNGLIRASLIRSLGAGNCVGINGNGTTATYRRAEVRDVVATFRSNGAQFRNFGADRNTDFTPERFKSRIQRPSNRFGRGASLNCLRIADDSRRWATTTGARHEGFPFEHYNYIDSRGVQRPQPAILTRSLFIEIANQRR